MNTIVNPVSCSRARGAVLPVFLGLLLVVSAACGKESIGTAMRIVPGLPEPLVPAAETSQAELDSIAATLRVFEARSADSSDYPQIAKPLLDYVAARPGTPWRAAIETNLGLGYYRAGYVSAALEHLELAWKHGKAASWPQAKALVDRAGGDLVRIHARLGNTERAEQLVRELESRAVTGPATEALTNAKEALAVLRDDPGNANLCGPMSLKSLLRALRPDEFPSAVLNRYKSKAQGVSLAELSVLAEEAGLRNRVVLREPHEPIPVPSVMHWKASHYAAIVGEKEGRYHLKDPTMDEGDLWVSRDAIDTESSGYFLVPEVAASGRRQVALADVTGVFGRGQTPDNDPKKTGPDEPKQCNAPTNGGAPKSAMCGYAVHTMLVSLSIQDSPVGYTPQLGPNVRTILYYSQREAYQPANFSYSNIGPKWTINWLSYIQDDPRFAGSNVTRYGMGGGTTAYGAYNATTGQFAPETRVAAALVRTGSSSYERRLPDGSVEVFSRSDGATVFPRRLFLTRKTDPAGNALTFLYDAQLRLTSIVDATGRSTAFQYAVTGFPLLISSIADPFGRKATFTYDAAGRLAKITDVIGMTSHLGYDASGLVTQLTTPYGTTGFAFGGTGTYRWLEATDPLGFTERYEYAHGAPGIPFAEARVPSAAGLGVFNAYINYRNTYYWDKHAYQVARGDYTKATIYHWLHDYTTGFTAGTLESIKKPLENRVWYSYPGQPSVIYNGSLDSPAVTARILDDNTTQARRFTYNAYGKPVSAVDPSGRKAVFTYAANGIDLLKVEQQVDTNGTMAVLAAFTYNAQHLPVTSTDAAGQATSYSYNAAGHLISVTNALNQTTRYTYDALGRLTSVIDANGSVQRSLVYDALDRIVTSIDSEGYALAYAYDALDRVTQVTYPDGTTTQSTYERLDLSAVKDRQGRVTRNAYDANRRLVSVTDPLSQVTRYGYYANGVLAGVTDPRGNATSWTIDIQSRPTAKHYADGRTETYAYENATSRVKSVRDALNQVKTYAYFQDDLLRGLTYTGALNPTPDVSFTYDPFFKRRVTMVDGIGTTRWSYVPIGTAGALQVASEDGPYANDTITYGYDALGRVTSRTVDVAAESFAYDAIGRLTNHSSVLGAFNRTYLGATNQLTSQLASTGTVGTQWVYDSNANDRRLRSIVNRGAARAFAFRISPENLITGITESGGGAPELSWTYGYDDANRITAARSSTGSSYVYRYDASDNMTSVNGTMAIYNSVNQIRAFGGASYRFDSNGNLLSDGLRTFTWDAQNRLQGVAIPSQGRSSSFKYDGLGRRIAITDISGDTSTETRYVWCGDFVCQGRTSADQVTRRYFAEGQVNPQSSSLLYYGVDQLGSVRDVLAAQNGAKVAGYEYDPYGKITSATGRISTDFRYAGLFYHGGSGLYLASYRAYDATSTRWISRDPIAERGGLNLYAYVSSNPISYADPRGDIAPLLLCAANPICRGAVLGAVAAAGDIAYQLYNKGCVDWKEAAGWALGGVLASEGIGAGLSGGQATVFWSGFRLGARDIAESIGGTTLESTPIGGALDYLTNTVGIPIPTGIWDVASAIFAGNAEGTPIAVILAEGETWSTIESVILRTRGVIPVFWFP